MISLFTAIIILRITKKRRKNETQVVEEKKNKKNRIYLYCKQTCPHLACRPRSTPLRPT